MRDPNNTELNSARRAGSHLLLAVAIFSFFVNLLMLTGPLFMLQVYDRVLGSRSEETLVALILLVAMLFALMAGLDYARGRVMARYGARFQDQLTAPVFAASLASSRTSGAQGLRDLDAVQGLFTSTALFAVFDIPWTPIFLAAIFIFHPWLGWLAVGGGALLVVITLLNQLLTKRRVNQSATLSEAAHKQAVNYFQDSELITSQGMQNAVRNRWLRTRDASVADTLAAADFSGLFTSSSKSIRLFLQSAILALGAYLVLQSELTAGAMIAASILLGRALAPIELAIGQWPLIVRARAGWVGLKSLLAGAPDATPKTKLPVPNAHLSVKNMAVISPADRKAIVAGISFELPPGQALGVIGKSGSGKTTLAKALLGISQPATGEVRLDGNLLENYDAAFLGAQIGYLPQTVTLFDGTIAENIARMAENPDDAAVVTAAQKANAHALIQSLPKGYDTRVESAEGYLSGGQKQRIGLARALYGDPVMLVLDEPNAALDHDGTEALNKAVRDMKAAGKIVVIMTHRPMAIAEADLLLYLDGGRAAAFGPRDEVLKAILKNAQGVANTVSKKADQT